MSEINQDDDFLCGVCGRVHVRSDQDADCAQARIAELEAEVEKWRRCEAFWRGRADEARAQRDLLAEALEALNQATRLAIFPESVRMVISGEDWRRLWESMHGADAALAELEEKR